MRLEYIRSGEGFNPNSIPDLGFFYIADSTPEAWTPYWGDDSGNGRVKYATSLVNSPTYTPVFVAGKPALSFSVTDHLISQDITFDQKFHDGTGCTFWLHFRTTGLAATQVLIATNNLAGIGHYVSHNGATQNIVSQIRNGVGAISTYNGAAGTAPINSDIIFISRISNALAPAVQHWINNVSVFTSTLVGPSVGVNPVGAQRIGQNTAAGSQYTGAIRSYGMYTRGLLGDNTFGEIKQLMDGIPNLISRRSVRNIWFAGDSLVAGANTARNRMWYIAQAGGTQRINFLGSQAAGVYTLPDPNSEGYSGFTIAQLNAVIQPLSQPTATDLLLMIGTNDAVAEDFTNPAILAAALARLQICMASFEARVGPTTRKRLVTPPLSTSATVGPRIAAYNAALPAIAAARNWFFTDTQVGPFALVAGDVSGDLIHLTACTPPAPPNADTFGYDKEGKTICNDLAI